MIGTRILNYNLTKKIGQGGMATVYEAKHITFDDRKVAIKVLDPILSRNIDVTSRFKNEAKIMASINHQNIVKVIDFDSENETLAIIMELLDGQNLSDIIEQKKLSFEQKINIFKQILQAIDYGHQRNIVHRDIKPTNVFLTNNNTTAKILDFGIAKLLDSDNQKTATGLTMGTPMFMSPEQVKGKRDINQKSDIYSLGVLLYYMISEKTPYDNNESQYDILTNIVNKPLPELKNEDQINLIIKKATAKNRDERYLNCSEFLNALDNNNELSGFISINEDFLDKNDDEKQNAELEKQKNDKKQAEENRILQEEKQKKLEQDKILAEQKNQQKAELEKQKNDKKQAEENRILQEERKKLEQDKITPVPKLKRKKEKKKTWLYILPLLLLLFIFIFLSNKYNFFGNSTWENNYGGTKNDEAFCILADENNIFACGLTKSNGASMDWYLLKINSNGDIDWEKNIDAFGSGDVAHAIIKTNDNNYVMVGGAYKDDNYKSQNRIIKFDKNGDIIWNKVYGYFGWDETVDITKADNNSFIMIFTDDTKENIRCGVFKISSRGNLIWEQSIGEHGNYSPRDIIKINNSEYLICGKVTLSSKTTKAFIAKINSKGKVIFDKIIGENNTITSANSMVKTDDGNIIITGFNNIGNNTGTDIWMSKINTNGEIIYERNIAQTNKQVSLSIAKTTDKHFVLAGYSTNNNEKTEGLIIKINEDLEVIWQRKYGNSSNNKFQSISVSNKDFFATGYTTSENGDKDLWIIKDKL